MESLPTFNVTHLLLFGLTLFLVYVLFFKKRRPNGMPPGPRPWPVVGNLFQLGFEPHKTFMQMSKKYGAVFSIDYGGYPAIVINDPVLMKSYFSEMAFSGRPHFRWLVERGGGDVPRGLISTELNDWVEQRRFVLKNLRDFGFGRTSLEDSIKEDVEELIGRFRENAGQPIITQDAFSLAVVNSLWKIISGEKLSQKDEKMTNLLKIITSSISNVGALGLCIFFPSLTRLAPNLTGYNNLIEYHFDVLKLIAELTSKEDKTFQMDHKRHLVDAYLQEIKLTADPSSSFFGQAAEGHMSASIMDLFLTGTETTSTTLAWVCLVLALHPQIQEKLHKEVTSVVGNSRLPRIDDKPSMPYTECLIMEVLRFSSLIPLGLFHSATEDVMIDGWEIPKGTVITSNFYGAMHDADIWGDPEVIRPERFISENGTINRQHEAWMPFGVGKRQCIGESLARNELFLFTTSLCQQFKFETDPSRPKPTLDYIAGFTLNPKPHYLILQERLTE